MRMWLVPPKYLCRQHLLGEHVEMHMFAGYLRTGRPLGGYASLCETGLIAERHAQLAREMVSRGYAHGSPLEYTDRFQGGCVDRIASLAELLRRCPRCRQRFDAVHGLAGEHGRDPQDNPS